MLRRSADCRKFDQLPTLFKWNPPRPPPIRIWNVELNHLCHGHHLRSRRRANNCSGPGAITPFLTYLDAERGESGIAWTNVLNLRMIARALRMAKVSCFRLREACTLRGRSTTRVSPTVRRRPIPHSPACRSLLRRYRAAARVPIPSSHSRGTRHNHNPNVPQPGLEAFCFALGKPRPTRVRELPHRAMDPFSARTA